jgi:SPP1 gp7 family putative phage head morphogenesis protein
MADEPLFRTAPKEVVDYFDRRPSVPTFDWRDLAPHEHALAHTVAKTAGMEVLDDLRAAIRKAVVDRMPYEQFRDELIPLLKKKGWWGEKKLRDEKTGELVKAQLGSPRRLQIIYWANVHSSHAAGEWKRIERNKEFLPWLTYVASVSERKRPLHMSWVGTTLPVDDAWWRSHYPPNGWNCKCSVRQVGDREAGRLHREFGRDKAPPLDERDWLNKRTGQVEQVPAGIDPGWQSNSGLLRDRTITGQLQGALDRMPETVRRAAVEKLNTHPVADYVRGSLGAMKRSELSRDQQTFAAVVAQLPVGTATAIRSKTTIVRLSGDNAAHIIGDHPEITPDILERLGGMLDGEAFRDANGVAIFKEIDGRLYRVKVKLTGNREELYVTTLHRSYAEQLERWRQSRDRVE